jgi:hypothetical protein
MSSTDSDSGIFETKWEKSRAVLYSVVNKNTILRFRDDIRDIFIEEIDTSNATDEDLRQWMISGRKGLEQTKWRLFSVGNLARYLKALETGLMLVLFMILREVFSLTYLAIFTLI